jgi:glutamine synthetase
VTFRFSDAITTCDNHVIYKTGAKEIAHQEGMSLTFMPKWDEREGNSCHIHISFRSTAGGPVMAADSEQGFSAMMGHFIAGQLACAPEMTYFYAPNVNSYKRFACRTGSVRLRRHRLGTGPGF